MTLSPAWYSRWWPACLPEDEARVATALDEGALCLSLAEAVRHAIHAIAGVSVHMVQTNEERVAAFMVEDHHGWVSWWRSTERLWVGRRDQSFNERCAARLSAGPAAGDPPRMVASDMSPTFGEVVRTRRDLQVLTARRNYLLMVLEGHAMVSSHSPAQAVASPWDLDSPRPPVHSLAALSLWWTARMDDGYSPEAALALLQLTLPPGAGSHLTFDPSSRLAPTYAPYISTSVYPLPADLACETSVAA